MAKSNSFWMLFLSNFKIMFRNYRGMFFNLFLPILLYAGISKVSGFLSSAGPSNSYANYLLPGIIAMTAMQTGIFSVSYWLIDMRSTGALKRFLVTPLSPLEMVASVVASRLTLIMTQAVLLVAIGILFFDAKIYGHFISVLILLALGGAVFLSIGFLISSIAGSYEEAAPITTIINLLFTFLGNIFFSTGQFPPILKEVGAVLPVTYLSNGLRNNFLQTDWTFVKSLPSIAGLLVWLIILLAANVALFKSKED